MVPVTSDSLVVGKKSQARSIAFKQLKNHEACYGLFWLGGFMSDMEGKKALACEEWALEHKADCLRFDYSGHGASGGAFSEGTISRWLEEAETLFHTLTRGDQVILGSSMGGWLALLLMSRLIKSGDQKRIKALVLIAPATDMTKDLMEDSASDEERATLETEGVIYRASEYGPPYAITKTLIEDGRQHLLFPELLSLPCPVYILQGKQDRPVPWQHSAKLVDHLIGADVSISYINDGDHSLSRPEDLLRLKAVLTQISEG